MFNYFRQMEPNSVLLFELRQAVRNRLVIGLMSVYLLLMVGGFFALLCFEDSVSIIDHFFSRYLSMSFANNASQLAGVILTAYYIFTTLTLVVSAAVRTASDRLYESPILYTMLTPQRIVFGKMLFGFVIGLLFLSLTLPFLSVAYLMRGLDMPTVMMRIILSYGLIQIQYFATIAFFAGAKNYTRIGAILFPALLFQYLLILFSIYVIGSVEFNSTDNNIFEFLSIFLSFLMIMTGIFLLATVQFAPPTSNRMFLVRVTFISIQLFLSVSCFISMLVEKIYGDTGDYAVIFLTPFFLFNFGIPYLFLFCICERDTISPRIRQTIPKSFRFRLLAFPFYTGAANAMVWCVLVLFFEGIMFFIAYFCRDPRTHIDMTLPIFGGAFNFGLLLFDYCATTLFVYQIFLRRWFSRTWNWLIPFAFVGGVLVFILFVNMILRSFSILVIDIITMMEKTPFLPYPFPISFNNELIFRQMTIGLLWFALLLLPSLPWIRRHFKEFR